VKFDDFALVLHSGKDKWRFPCPSSVRIGQHCDGTSRFFKSKRATSKATIVVFSQINYIVSEQEMLFISSMAEHSSCILLQTADMHIYIMYRERHGYEKLRDVDSSDNCFCQSFL
jgi:hypothetical protein